MNRFAKSVCLASAVALSFVVGLTVRAESKAVPSPDVAALTARIESLERSPLFRLSECLKMQARPNPFPTTRLGTL